MKPEPDFLPIVEGRPLLQRPEGEPAKPLDTGSDGIALSADGKTLIFRVLAGRRLFEVPTDALWDRRPEAEVRAAVVDRGNLGFASDGLEHDAAGTLYLTNYEDNALLARRPDGTFETILHDRRLLWPDTLSLAADGSLYVTANQLHRQPKFHRGEDLREKPYVLLRVKVGADPVALR